MFIGKRRRKERRDGGGKRRRKRRGTERRPMWLECRQNKEKCCKKDWTEGGDLGPRIQTDDHNCVCIYTQVPIQDRAK